MAVPTRDGTGMLQTAGDLLSLGGVLGRPARLWWTAYGSIPRARNALTEAIRAELGGRLSAWVLWVDSDILLQDGNAEVAAAIQWSWRTGKAWVAHYRMADGRSHIMATRSMSGAQAPNLTQEEIDALPEWAEVGMSGFGMVFLPMPLDYLWHADRAGEDVHFWLDHPELKVHLAKRIQLLHRKDSWV